MVGALRPRRGAGLHAPRAGQCRGEPCAACCRASTTATSASRPTRAPRSRCSITVDRDKRTAKVDFTGTSAQQANNFNAPEPVTRAAVLYVFRVMVDEPIPMNAGCLKPIEIVIPEGSMLQPGLSGRRRRRQRRDQPDRHQRAVRRARRPRLGAGHDEQPHLRQRPSYSTTRRICSGAPAGPGFDGAAGVHVHMTNTRLTDPEILELRYPGAAGGVLASAAARAARANGRSGDGTRRVIRFLERMNCAILSGYRAGAPVRR